MKDLIQHSDADLDRISEMLEISPGTSIKYASFAETTFFITVIAIRLIEHILCGLVPPNQNRTHPHLLYLATPWLLRSITFVQF